MSTSAPDTEIAIHRAGAQRMGFFTDTTVCIGCKACEVACKQWNDLPADGSQSGKGVSYDHTGDLSASTWRHVRFVELFEPSPQLKEEAQRALDAGAGASCRRSRPPAQSTSWMLRSPPRASWTSPRRCARWAIGCSCPTSASTAPTRAVSMPAPPAR